MAPKAAHVPAGMEAVTGNEDLLSEILVRLPPKPLLRFKSVSKTWLRLISSAHLGRRSSRRLCKDVSGLLLMRKNKDFAPSRECEFFIPLHQNAGAGNSPLRRLDFVEGKLEVMSHCNGLLVCGTKHVTGSKRREFYVFNPTTKQYATVSANTILKLGENLRLGERCAYLTKVSLAFDPRKSLHYKLLFIYGTVTTNRLQVYSSDTRVMRLIDEPFSVQSCGVNWNNAVNWFYWEESLYFNVDEERFGKLPTLPVPQGRERDLRWVQYFGESNDHLHLIPNYSRRLIRLDVCHEMDDIDSRRFQLDVYEMDRGYSGWFMRYRVNLLPVFNSLQFSDECFRVMGVIRKDDDEASFLVLSLPGKVFRFNFEDESSAMICVTREGDVHNWVNTIPFMESLYHP